MRSKLVVPFMLGRADPLERPEILVVVVLGPLEHQVFEQVGEPGLAGLFVLRADVVPDVDGHDRRLAVGVDDDGQAIGQAEFFERNQR